MQAFSKFVKSREHCESSGDRSWRCCSDEPFKDTRAFHRHVSHKHAEEIEKSASEIIQNGSHDAKWKALAPCDKAAENGESLFCFC